MDKNVIPLVQYFNSQGLKTQMSCEGHNKTNMSMFWISFDNMVQEQDIINFQKKHLNKKYDTFSSCGRFAQRLYIGEPTIVKQWYYFAATIEAAYQDLKWWEEDDKNVS